MSSRQPNIRPRPTALFTMTDLSTPIIQAPMAGGPSTPDLAAAVSNAGGLGFLAAGYRSADQVAGDITAVRARTTGPFGVNFFVPQRSVGVDNDLRTYADELKGDAARYDTAVGEQRTDDDDWEGKLVVLEKMRPPVVSFTFGAPPAATTAKLQGAGIFVMVTVTTEDEAATAIALGVDALLVQGPEAGGHRGTFDPAVVPETKPLDLLLTGIAAKTDLPLIAAGSISTSSDVRNVLRRGAAAAQAGTAFLLADEAGTKSAHRDALTSGQFGRTIITRAFSGRYARGLLNDFIRHHDQSAPLGYPQVHHMTSPIRAAAAAAHDPQRLSLWAGTGYRLARAAPAATIVAHLGSV